MFNPYKASTSSRSKLRIGLRLLSDIAIACKADDVTCLKKCISSDIYEIILEDLGGLSDKYLQNAIDLTRHRLLTEQNDRLKWWFSHGTLDTSEDEHWLSWFRQQGIKPKDFMKDLVEWMGMVHPKKNAFKLWGPPSGGKSMVANCISEPFLSHFQGMTNAHSEFALEGMLDTSIAIVEEAFLIPKEADDYKQLMSGGGLSINKKYFPKQTIERVPVLITSNHIQMGRGYLKQADEKALNTRCYIYKISTPTEPKIKLTSAGFIGLACRVLGKDQETMLPPQIIQKSSEVVAIMQEKYLQSNGRSRLSRYSSHLLRQRGNRYHPLL